MLILDLVICSVFRHAACDALLSVDTNTVFSRPRNPINPNLDRTQRNACVNQCFLLLRTH
jgi:hypothetical protein